jgi:hypothetical protein
MNPASKSTWLLLARNRLTAPLGRKVELTNLPGSYTQIKDKSWLETSRRRLAKAPRSFLEGISNPDRQYCSTNKFCDTIEDVLLKLLSGPRVWGSFKLKGQQITWARLRLRRGNGEFMSNFKMEKQESSAAGRLAILIAGDLLVLLVVIGWGRSRHALPISDVSAWLFTAAPFIIAWFAVIPWFGLFRAEVSQSWPRLVPRLLLAWVIGVLLAVVLRALFLGRSIPGGIIPVFALVMLGTTTPAMLVWRLGYCWWANRRLPHNSSTKEA